MHQGEIQHPQPSAILDYASLILHATSPAPVSPSQTDETETRPTLKERLARSTLCKPRTHQRACSLFGQLHQQQKLRPRQQHKANAAAKAKCRLGHGLSGCIADMRCKAASECCAVQKLSRTARKASFFAFLVNWTVGN